MKSNAPWSVKGIERDARETAKEAAKREGMTVGEWLNQMIYSAGDPESSGGHVEGLKLRDVVTAIDHLHKRIADSSSETGELVTDISRKMGDIVERVQRLERSKAVGGDRERVDALKALEKAVSQVAVQFSNAQKTTLERLDATEKGIEKLTAQLGASADGDDASGVGFLKDAVDGLQTRMARTERLAGEAAKGQGGGDAAFQESTSNRLRVLGDEIKRGGDQVRTLETTIGKLSEQIEAAERRSAEGVQKTAETLAELREKFAGEAGDATSKDEIASVVASQTRETTERVDRLQASFETMIAQLDGLSGGATSASDLSGPAGVSDDAESTDENAHALEETLESDPSAEGHAPEMELLDDDHAAPEAADTAKTIEDEAPHGTAAKAADQAEDNDDDDDDFFSFADEIDASIEEAPEAEHDEEFSFELDGGDNDQAETKDPAEAKDDAAGAALLSEVQKVFSGKNDSIDEKQDERAATGDDDEAAAEKKTSVDDELDELLAGLDDVNEMEASEEGAKAETDQEDGDADPETSDGVQSKEDLLKSIRRKAREEAAARAAEEEKESERPTRRKLTPKQKAILAARARRKRLAEQQGDKEEAAKKAAATKKAFEESAKADSAQDAAIDEEDDEEAGGFAGLRGKFPFFGGDRKKEAEDDAATAALRDDADGDHEALETLKSTASARPVTLALGVGIFLAIGVLFFALKDFVFPSDNNEPARSGAVSAEPAPQAAAEPTIEAPAPPAIDPKTLYRDAMTGLNAAGNEAETGVAIEKLEQAALLGHPPAQLQLGELFKTGQGVDQDLAQARTWFRRAANGGNVLAMHRVGVMTARGEGGSANTPEAISWFEQAANRGLVDSQYNLGAIYHPAGEGETQDGGLQDAGKAYYWYSLAAQNGDEQASPLAAGVGATISEDQRAELDEAITAWTALPADIEANTLANAG